MHDLEELYEKIKHSKNEGNVLIPKEYLKKFILTNLLIVKEKNVIDKNDIFNYLSDDKFILPSGYDQLDDNKKQKYLNSLETLAKLL